MIAPINLDERHDHELSFPMTVEQFLAWEDVHAEWVDGEVTVFMPVSELHQAISNFFETLLTLYVKLYNLGIIRSAPYSMRAQSGGPIREPDLMFIADENIGRALQPFLDGPADLVIEIISPSSVARDRADKFYEYQDAGIREYLIIDSREGKQRVDYYALNEQGRYDAIVTDNQGKYYSTVIKGFWFREEWLWQEISPDILRVLLEIAPDAVKKTIQDSNEEG